MGSMKKVTTTGNKSGKREKKIAASQSENTKGSPTGLPDHEEDIEINICAESSMHDNSCDDAASSADEPVSITKSQKRVLTAVKEQNEGLDYTASSAGSP